MSKMTDDHSWVFDSLVCFLHGPVWNAPLQTFIEEKSLIFDPNEKLDEENEEIKKVHDEYKNLVDYMLGSFMEEMQISPEQFEVACLEGRHLRNNENTETSDHNGFSFHQGLFQQIWAANDIRIFNRMMTQRNLELQLQALDLIERRQTNDKAIDPEMLEQTKELEVLNDKNIDIFPTTSDIELEKFIETKDPKYSGISGYNHEIDDKFQRLNLFFETGRVSSGDIKARQEYLRNQRDKILEIKKKARTRQLNDSVKKNGRPSSAHAAQKLMQGEIENVSSDPSESSILLRKTLAKRLRTEVVDQE